ncbi:CRP-like cAMP-binding protein/CheY-like chemotaxis protein [Dyadobacter sp. BE34]|uniref:CRP-like cAMP-binding protein/CheY-like chemotaxis protein n=1 Tax=Dyadobacter fermentans TaxID=94254 RepID=A0ABU1QT84_9BACT|nr:MULTISPECIES: response regulator [Dyadobacter]MDR6804344.1 CRP-like cAMP-binding protein/CheY-like chemotaxis protein [Dyadobacter fermentans]MDR7042084.1 CRP-like cAMP-binding protein/CheY-like chemotaxis protein [Dyadobacter sp. BE242]MDR7196487.1 CRP-like cAMP-binding protein/CheY-like chemotaxis protein [Dyadobacter sp. BE34]MDR7212968.1 CRP-like cAMP-binding protein/CheY-like chemotaxis protein [Dyadobacter sp. BE31]MDR7261893.1 CRP-like cAMP-binding protein/CheY-like chemotaxis protei
MEARKILLIEDNPEMRENTAEILELANFEVITAQNGKEGVQQAGQHHPDLIICDIMMPELDGYGVLHMLGKDERTASIPFIFLTAKAEKEDYRKGMTMGADDYLTKPYDDVELLNAVEMRLKKSDRLKKQFERSADGFDQFIKEAQAFDPIVKLAEDKKVKVLRKKETIYTEGSFPSHVFFLQKGKVKAYKSNENGKEYITDLLKEGEFFGYLDLLQGAPYEETAIALEKSEVAMIPKDDFFNLLQGNREVASKFIRMLSNEIKEREERLLQLAYNSVRKRVAQALVMLVQRYQEDRSKPFSMAVTREDIASMVGTATETVIRTLSDFKDERLVDMKGSQITVLEYEKLVRMRN